MQASGWIPFRKYVAMHISRKCTDFLLLSLIFPTKLFKYDELLKLTRNGGHLEVMNVSSSVLHTNNVNYIKD